MTPLICGTRLCSSRQQCDRQKVGMRCDWMMLSGSTRNPGHRGARPGVGPRRTSGGGSTLIDHSSVDARSGPHVACPPPPQGVRSREPGAGSRESGVGWRSSVPANRGSLLLVGSFVLDARIGPHVSCPRPPRSREPRIGSRYSGAGDGVARYRPTAGH